MVPAAQIANTFQSNHWVGKRLLEGVTQEDSLLQPPYPGNCINWILGHLVGNRNTALTLLEKPNHWSDAELERYATGSDPVIEGSGQRFEVLLEDFDRTQIEIEAALEESSPEFLRQSIETKQGKVPRWKRLSGLAWHETYHIGQLELLRQYGMDQRGEGRAHFP